MSLLYLWMPREPQRPTAAVLAGMARALRPHDGMEEGSWVLEGLAVGLLELGDEVSTRYAPARDESGRHYLWMAGEIYATEDRLPLLSTEHSRGLAFRRRLLDYLLRNGLESIRHFDGQYQIVLWDEEARKLNVLGDRFGSLPLFWSDSSEGFACAGGVRAVLMAPGISSEPDREAIEEAVTFGGFRLGDRTNVRSVKLFPEASHLTVVDSELRFRSYWGWESIPPVTNADGGELVETARELWRDAVERRLDGSRRPGQTLSGGLDSRAILAEAAPRSPGWTAITYGIEDCDDARYARRAAAAAGATWLFHPLYQADWLGLRDRFVQVTDGLIQLGDLMHLECLSLKCERMDLELSGYVGDAVCGDTFDGVTTPWGLVRSLPFYGTALGWSDHKALAWAEEQCSAIENRGPIRQLLFHHKCRQAPHFDFHASSSWIRVRKPFLDYRLFDFFNGLPLPVRSHLYHRFLKECYRDCFGRIPNQKTGVPILTPHWLYQAARVRRFGWRKLQERLSAMGMPVQPRRRNFIDDVLHWSRSPYRERIRQTILRKGSLSCDILGRDATKTLVDAYLDQGAAPTQVVGALYVYEAYHSGLSEHLRSARV